MVLISTPRSEACDRRRCAAYVVQEIVDTPAHIHTLEGHRRHPQGLSVRWGHQSLKTTEMYLRTDPAEKLDMLSEWHSPGPRQGTIHGSEGCADGDAIERLSRKSYGNADHRKRRVMTAC